MYEINISIEKIIHDKRAVHKLLEQGYKTYYDIKDLTLDELQSIQGIGAVSAARAYSDIEYYKKNLYKEVSERAVALADKIGAERVLEILEESYKLDL